MRVVFDAYWWVNGPAALRHVLREIVLAWHQEFPGDTLALVVRRGEEHEVRASAPPGTTVVPTRLRPQALLASVAAERVRRRLGYDVVLVHNFAARSRGTSAVYLHDVMFVTNPEWFSRIELAYFSRMVRWAPRADVVFASTATEAGRIRAHTAAQRVLPVGLGLSTELLHGGDERAVAGLEPHGFLLTVGRLNVRKNLGRSILGALASGEVSAQRPLVVVGGAGGKSEQPDPEVERATADGLVRFLGHVDEAQLRWLYRHTRAFVFLSLGEGFGMPPVEALAFGAPVVVSDLPVFRENLAGRATFTDPCDTEAIAGALRSTLAAGRSQADADETAAAVAIQHDWRSSVRRMRGALAERVAGTGTGTVPAGAREDIP